MTDFADSYFIYTLCHWLLARRSAALPIWLLIAVNSQTVDNCWWIVGLELG